LVYLMQGDYENARASFKGGQLQDSLADDQKYAADFASLQWLEGWADHCLGQPNTAQEKFAAAAQMRPGLLPPPPDARLLLIAESGTGPVKVGEGQHKEKLTFQAGELAPQGPIFELAGQTMPTPVAEDLLMQASTRGGRQIDGILNGKAQFKDTTQTVADVGLIGGSSLAQANYQDMQMRNAYGTGPNTANTAMAVFSLGMMAAGLVSQAVSAATTPEADTRYWDNLPGTIHLAGFGTPAAAPALPPGEIDPSKAVAVASLAETVPEAPAAGPMPAEAEPAADASATQAIGAEKAQAIGEALPAAEPAPVEAAAVTPAVLTIPAEATLRLASGETSTVPVREAGACSIAWGRSKSALAVPDSAPGAVASN
jgi:hypothetical protein